MRLPPGPSQHRFVQLARWMRTPMEFLEDCRARYGETFTVRLPTMPPFVVLTTPESVREVFSGSHDEMSAGQANITLKPFLGEHSLLLLDGPEHLRQRRLVLPPFHGERMQAYGAQMVAFADASVDRWPVGSPFAMHKPMQDVTLQVILRAVFGLDEGLVFDRAAETISRTMEAAVWPPLLLPAMQIDLGPWSPWGRFVRAAARGDAVIFEQIRRRRAEGTAGRTDVLSMLLDARDESGQPMTDQELRDELKTLLVAGHETTATSLAWTFHWLLEFPEAMKNLRAELDAAAASGPLTPERIAKLTYLDATVREGLRLQPVIPLVGRVLRAPRRVAGYDLPAGVGVIPSIYLSARREEAFPGASRFDPAHFIDRKPNAYEWFPFGGGMRRCIGMAFALYEMKMVLATVLQRVELRRAPGPPVRVVRRGITLAPSGGTRVIVTARRPAVRRTPASAPAHSAGG